MSYAFLDPLIPGIAVALASPVVVGIAKRIVNHVRTSRLDVTVRVMGQSISVEVGRGTTHEEVNRKILEKIGERRPDAG